MLNSQQIAELRELAATLSLSVLSERNLAKALGWLSRQFGREKGQRRPYSPRRPELTSTRVSPRGNRLPKRRRALTSLAATVPREVDDVKRRSHRG